MGDGNFLKRRESVSYSKSKTNNFSKKMTIHKNHKKCFSCACCSKKIKNDHKTNKDLAKRKQSLGERRVSVAERLRRASMTAREDN